MQVNKNKNAVLMSIYCKKQKLRLNSTPDVIIKQTSINNFCGQRMKTEQSRRIQTIKNQKFKLQYRSESREPLKSSNISKQLLSDSRKQSNYESNINTTASENEDKALMIHKIIFSVKSPLQSLRFQTNILDKKQYMLNQSIYRRKTLKTSLLTQSFQNQSFFREGNETGWSRKSSESLVFI